VRSLRLVPENFYIVGVDANKHHLQRACADERILVPLAGEPDYLSVLNLIIAEKNIQLVYSQNDQEIGFISENRERIKAKTYLPDPKTVKICQDKFASYEKWSKAGIKVPKTILLRNVEDLQNAFRVLGAPLWIRETSGAFGRNSLPANKMEHAQYWIDFHEGWGRFSAAEFLGDQSTTWQSMWWHGELIVAQGRKRLYWEFSNRTPSGITGLTGTGVTVSDPDLDETALRAIRAIDASPHGIFSVDLTYDKDGIPNPTEINAGRFFTTHFFFSHAGLNMPYVFVKLALDEKPPAIFQKLNPLPEGLVWIRGMDMEPVLTTLTEIDTYEKQLKEMRRRLRKKED
jgi:carbamoyl-phosphate synthase large subunit